MSYLQRSMLKALILVAMVVTTGFIAGNIFLPKKSYPVVILNDWVEEEDNIFTFLHFGFQSRSDERPMLWKNITYFDLIDLNDIRESPYWLLYVHENTTKQSTTYQIISQGAEPDNITYEKVTFTFTPESYLLPKNMSSSITNSFIQTIRPVITSGVKITNEEYRNFRIGYFENYENDMNRFTASIKVIDMNNTVVYITFYNTGITVSATTLGYLQDKNEEKIYPPRGVDHYFLEIESFEETFDSPFVQTWNSIFQSLTN